MRRSALRSTFGILLFGVSLQLYSQALAITVTNLNDSGPGSLRQAIADAPAGGTIDFAVTGTIVLTSGQLVFTNDLTVNGPGATNLTVSQNLGDRILEVSNGDVTISGLAIANGRPLGNYEDGGGIKNLAALTLRNCLVASNYANRNGGGIYNEGTLIVQDSLIKSNTAGVLGGGIANFYGGATTIVGSTICSNNADIFHGWVAGGGIHTGSNRYLVVSNSTVSGNQWYGIMSYGGGGETVLISSSTLANNQQGDMGTEGGHAVIRNSIIKACGGFFTSEDYNLIQSTEFSTFITGATNHNIYGLDPKLGPLADNGGPTPTHALRFDSPAIDAGQSGGVITDQRGLPRPIDGPNIPNADGGDGCDIGAYEADPIVKVTGFEAAGAQVRVGFDSVLGRSYRLESKTNLENSWTTNSDNIPGTGSANQTVNAGTANLPRQFYRVKLLP